MNFLIFSYNVPASLHEIMFPESEYIQKDKIHIWIIPLH